MPAILIGFAGFHAEATLGSALDAIATGQADFVCDTVIGCFKVWVDRIFGFGITSDRQKRCREESNTNRAIGTGNRAATRDGAITFLLRSVADAISNSRTVEVGTARVANIGGTSERGSDRSDYDGH